MAKGRKAKVCGLNFFIYSELFFLTNKPAELVKCFQGGGNIMPTISSILQKNDMLANVSHRYFKLDTDAADKSVLIGAAVRTSADFQKSDFGGQPALTNLVENYSAEKENFHSTMQDKLISLQESSDKLKDSVQEDSEKISSTSTAEETESEEKENRSALSTLGNFAKNNIPPRAKILQFPQMMSRSDNDKTEEIEKQVEKLREEKAETLKNSNRDSFKDFAENYLVKDEDKGMLQPFEVGEDDKISAVKNFVRDFNSTLSYLNENRSMSNRISALAETFNGTEELSASLKEIGITVTSSGRLSVNEEILEHAIERNPEAVTSLLGDGGLAGQLDRVLNLANYQGENLFPTINEYAGEEEFESWEYLYSAQTMTTANYTQDRAKNLLNTFT